MLTGTFPNERFPINAILLIFVMVTVDVPYHAEYALELVLLCAWA